MSARRRAAALRHILSSSLQTRTPDAGMHKHACGGYEPRAIISLPFPLCNCIRRCLYCSFRASAVPASPTLQPSPPPACLLSSPTHSCMPCSSHTSDCLDAPTALHVTSDSPEWLPSSPVFIGSLQARALVTEALPCLVGSSRAARAGAGQWRRPAAPAALGQRGTRAYRKAGSCLHTGPNSNLRACRQRAQEEAAAGSPRLVEFEFRRAQRATPPAPSLAMSARRGALLIVGALLLACAAQGGAADASAICSWRC